MVFIEETETCHVYIYRVVEAMCIDDGQDYAYV
jgi:hypothetical protein